MARLKLAIVGSSAYAGRLAECIRKNAPEYLEILNCACKGEISDEISEFLSQTQPDIMLYEQLADAENHVSLNTVRIQLVAEEYVLNNPQEDPAVIFRYQKGPEILRQIFQIYEKISKKNLICWCKTMNLEMTAFYAPGGHEFLLPFSLSYAANSKGKGKVLYLNLSEFSGMADIMGDKDGGNFSDLIYGIRQRKERFLVCLQSVLHHTEAFDYVLPPENPQDIYEIGEEDLACLLSLLREQTEYELVVWNCGTLNQSVRQVLNYCSKIYCVIKETLFGKSRKAEFEKFLEKEAVRGIKEKLQYVNPQINYINGSGGLTQGTDVVNWLQNGEFAELSVRLQQD